VATELEGQTSADESANQSTSGKKIMYWENLVFDAAGPHDHGRFWEDLLRGETLSDNAGGFETRLTFSENAYLDLCFPIVKDVSESTQRYFPLIVESGRASASKTPSFASSRKKLQDVAGRKYFLFEPGDESVQFELSAVEIQSTDPLKDAEFWSFLTGFSATPQEPTVLKHPEGLYPALVLVNEDQSKSGVKSSVHLDLRLEANDDMELILQRILNLGGVELDHRWGDIPWRVFLDPSGNEFCILPNVASAA